ncbi:hypothetical protein MP228_009643 [Amoeboaphelidium protococcarum]|nr:hypothetical protein MP228_009643 [Amoeboaphelidium protococcarum]
MWFSRFSKSLNLNTPSTGDSQNNNNSTTNSQINDDKSTSKHNTTADQKRLSTTRALIARITDSLCLTPYPWQRVTKKDSNRVYIKDLLYALKDMLGNTRNPIIILLNLSHKEYSFNMSANSIQQLQQDQNASKQLNLASLIVEKDLPQYFVYHMPFKSDLDGILHLINLINALNQLLSGHKLGMVAINCLNGDRSFLVANLLKAYNYGKWQSVFSCVKTPQDYLYTLYLQSLLVNRHLISNSRSEAYLLGVHTAVLMGSGSSSSAGQNIDNVHVEVRMKDETVWSSLVVLQIANGGFYEDDEDQQQLFEQMHRLTQAAKLNDDIEIRLVAFLRRQSQIGSGLQSTPSKQSSLQSDDNGGHSTQFQSQLKQTASESEFYSKVILAQGTINLLFLPQSGVITLQSGLTNYLEHLNTSSGVLELSSFAQRCGFLGVRLQLILNDSPILPQSINRSVFNDSPLVLHKVIVNSVPKLVQSDRKVKPLLEIYGQRIKFQNDGDGQIKISNEKQLLYSSQIHQANLKKRKLSIDRNSRGSQSLRPESRLTGSYSVNSILTDLSSKEAIADSNGQQLQSSSRRSSLDQPQLESQLNEYQSESQFTLNDYLEDDDPVYVDSDFVFFRLNSLGSRLQQGSNESSLDAITSGAGGGFVIDGSYSKLELVVNHFDDATSSLVPLCTYTMLPFMISDNGAGMFRVSNSKAFQSPISRRASQLAANIGQFVQKALSPQSDHDSVRMHSPDVAVDDDFSIDSTVGKLLFTSALDPSNTQSPIQFADNFCLDLVFIENLRLYLDEEQDEKQEMAVVTDTLSQQTLSASKQALSATRGVTNVLEQCSVQADSELCFIFCRQPVSQDLQLDLQQVRKFLKAPGNSDLPIFVDLQMTCDLKKTQEDVQKCFENGANLPQKQIFENQSLQQWFINGFYSVLGDNSSQEQQQQQEINNQHHQWWHPLIVKLALCMQRNQIHDAHSFLAVDLPKKLYLQLVLECIIYYYENYRNDQTTLQSVYDELIVTSPIEAQLPVSNESVIDGLLPSYQTRRQQEKGDDDLRDDVQDDQQDASSYRKDGQLHQKEVNDKQQSPVREALPSASSSSLPPPPPMPQLTQGGSFVVSQTEEVTSNSVQPPGGVPPPPPMPVHSAGGVPLPPPPPMAGGIAPGGAAGPDLNRKHVRVTLHWDALKQQDLQALSNIGRKKTIWMEDSDEDVDDDYGDVDADSQQLEEKDDEVDDNTDSKDKLVVESDSTSQSKPRNKRVSMWMNVRDSINVDKFEELFCEDPEELQRKKKQLAEQKLDGQKSDGKQSIERISVLDSNKAKNISIVLSKFERKCKSLVETSVNTAVSELAPDVKWTEVSQSSLQSMVFLKLLHVIILNMKVEWCANTSEVQLELEDYLALQKILPDQELLQEIQNWMRTKAKAFLDDESGEFALDEYLLRRLAFSDLFVIEFYQRNPVVNLMVNSSIIRLKYLAAHSLESQDQQRNQSNSGGNEVDVILQKLDVVEKVLLELQTNSGLKVILRAVLSLGNMTNYEYGKKSQFGRRGDRAVGFKIESLPKLRDVKARDGKSTLMNYLVEVLWGVPDLIMLPDHFEKIGLLVAKDYKTTDILSSISEVQQDYEQLVQLSRQDFAMDTRMKKLIEKDDGIRNSQQSQKQLSQISLILGKFAVDTAGVESLKQQYAEPVITEMQSRLQTLYARWAQCWQACIDTALYFGENPEDYDIISAQEQQEATLSTATYKSVADLPGSKAKRRWEDLFDVFHTFFVYYKEAVSQVKRHKDKERRAKERKQKQQAEQNKKDSTSKETTSSQTKNS